MYEDLTLVTAMLQLSIANTALDSSQEKQDYDDNSAHTLVVFKDFKTVISLIFPDWAITGRKIWKKSLLYLSLLVMEQSKG